MKHLTKYIGLIFILMIIGCAQNPDSLSLEIADENIVDIPSDQKSAELVDRKLIKIGKVEFETDNLNSTRKNIFEAVKIHKGYVSSDQEFKSTGRKSNTVVIRVPAENFDNLLSNATKGVEKFDRKEIEVKDVTEEFLDVQARLKTKKELEQRFIEILKKANTVTEILEIEKQIGHLRSEIESIEVRLKYLTDRVSFSTLEMTFYESISNETAFGQKFKNSFSNGWENLIWFFVALANVWPFILIALGVIFGYRIYNRKK